MYAYNDVWYGHIHSKYGFLWLFYKHPNKISYFDGCQTNALNEVKLSVSFVYLSNYLENKL